ncbi:MAG: DedA family protein [Magnetococcales bacterium]|nr:DedA family protein [Magnetococcales bacterium]
MALSGEYSASLLWLVATLGNLAGSVINWALGRYFIGYADRRWFPFSTDQIARAQQRFQRFGVWSLLLAWVPIIGDPITFIAGLLRVRFPIFLLLTALGKAGRYAVLLLAIGEITV